MAGANGSDAHATVAVIGAGIMGSAMTRNLVAAGVNTRVWDRSATATAPLAAAGAVVAPSAREAVRDADVVITMLPTADAVDSMIFDGGVADAFADAYMSILIEGVAETMELADRLGIGHQELADAIEGGPLDAPIADAKLHKMDRGDYAAEFPLEWALKDVDLAIGAVAGQAPPLLAALSGQWHAAVAAGHGRQDISAARLALGSVSPAS
jgi:3-hydroxyisobutyrate dehydrogenase-like beta-hydroxyacid dehydrogenase